MQNGIIIKGIGGFYYVKDDELNQITECKARGVFRKKKLTPMVGDRVVISGGNIDEIKERRNFMIRPPVANIDLLLIVIAAASPEPDLFLTDKLLVYAGTLGIEAAVCINKTDLKKGDKLSELYEAAGYKTVCISGSTGENIEELKKLLKNKITAFCGMSGVGKSTLLNRICNGDNIKTGDLSEKIKRGKHTTRHVELLELKGEEGYAFDTPGFSSLDITDITDIEAEELADYYPEFVKNECRFRTCIHINEPDCMVKKMMSEGKISRLRYDNYKEMYNILKNKKRNEYK